jgi:hypothetical protein
MALTLSPPQAATTEKEFMQTDSSQALISVKQSQHMVECRASKRPTPPRSVIDHLAVVAGHPTELDVRYGSLADIGERIRNVRFTLKAGHGLVDSSLRWGREGLLVTYRLPFVFFSLSKACSIKPK